MESGLRTKPCYNRRLLYSRSLESASQAVKWNDLCSNESTRICLGQDSILWQCFFRVEGENVRNSTAFWSSSNNGMLKEKCESRLTFYIYDEPSFPVNLSLILGFRCSEVHRYKIEHYTLTYSNCFVISFLFFFLFQWIADFSFCFFIEKVHYLWFSLQIFVLFE